MISFSKLLMHTRLNKVLVVVGLSGAASAPALAQNYEGPHQVRVGAFLQTGGTTLNGNFTPAIEGLPTTGSGRFNSSGAGITAGLEMLRYHGWSYGFEGDFGVTAGSKDIVNAAHYATDYFGSLRGRVGVYARPDLVFYGTAGLGFRGVRITESAGTGVDKSLLGGVIGAGGEWHRGNTIFFGEYLHNNYSSRTVTLASGSYGIKGDSDSFRLGVKFKVGFDGYYDEVRDDLRK